jgi:hypothetical protein
LIKLRLRYEHWIPRRLGVRAIVLYPYVLFSGGRAEVGPLLLRHEMIHVRQVRRSGWLRFYARYLKEYFFFRLRGNSGPEAYRKISFEDEAYALAEKIDLTEAEKREVDLA